MDHLLAHRLAVASNFAYTFDDVLLKDWEAPTTFVKINDDLPHATSYLAVLPRTDCTIVAFQGTITTSAHIEQSILDWLKNFRAERGPQHGAEVPLRSPANRRAACCRRR